MFHHAPTPQSLLIGKVHIFRRGYSAAWVVVGLTMYQWWRDVVRESTHQGCHTLRMAEGLQWGMLLFIVSEIFFFLSFFYEGFLLNIRKVGFTELGIEPECPIAFKILLLQFKSHPEISVSAFLFSFRQFVVKFLLCFVIFIIFISLFQFKLHQSSLKSNVPRIFRPVLWLLSFEIRSKCTILFWIQIWIVQFKCKILK